MAYLMILNFSGRRDPDNWKLQLASFPLNTVVAVDGPGEAAFAAFCGEQQYHLEWYFPFASSKDSKAFEDGYWVIQLS